MVQFDCGEKHHSYHKVPCKAHCLRRSIHFQTSSVNKKSFDEQMTTSVSLRLLFVMQTEASSPLHNSIWLILRFSFFFLCVWWMSLFRIISYSSFDTVRECESVCPAYSAAHRCWNWEMLVLNWCVCVCALDNRMNKCELLEKYALKLKLNKTNGMNHCDPTANEERKCANCHMFLVLLAEISTHTHPTNEQSEWIRSRNLLCYYCCSWTFQCTCRHRLLLLLLLFF